MVRQTIEAIRLLWAISKTQPTRPVVGVCLEGDTTIRLDATVDLYRRGKISHIIVSGGMPEGKRADEFPAERMKEILLSRGVAEENIILEPDSQNTAQQAKNVSDIVGRSGYSEILLIASGYHLLRAYLTFLKEVNRRGEPYALYGFPAGSIFSWLKKSKTENARRICIFWKNELQKIGKYQRKGDVAFFEDAWLYLRLSNTVMSGALTMSDLKRNEDKTSNKVSLTDQLTLYGILVQKLSQEGDGIWARFNILTAINTAMFGVFILIYQSERRPSNWREIGIALSVLGIVFSWRVLCVLNHLWLWHDHWKKKIGEIEGNFTQGMVKPFSDISSPPPTHRGRSTQPFVWLTFVVWGLLFLALCLRLL
jgi:hypothetical protein